MDIATAKVDATTMKELPHTPQLLTWQHDINSLDISSNHPIRYYNKYL